MSTPSTRRSSNTRTDAGALAGTALTNSQGAKRGRGRPATRAPDACSRCGRPGAKLPGRKFCPACAAAYHAQAVAWQERDALHRYLCTRDDLPNRGHLAKLRAQAKALGVDSRAEPPAPMTYDARLAIITHREPPRRKPAQPKAPALMEGGAA